MAEQTSEVANKKLLVIALLLGVVVVVIYNVHIAQVRRAASGSMVEYISVTRDIQASERLGQRDLEPVKLPKDVADRLGQLVPWKEAGYIAEEGATNQPLAKGQVLTYTQLVGSAGRRGPAAQLAEGMVAVPLEVDPQRSLGEILRVGDRVNVMGFLPAGTGYEAVRIIEGARVYAIGGRGEADTLSDARGHRDSEGQRTYRSVTIEVPRDVSPRLYNILSHVRGQAWLELPPEGTKAGGQVNPELSSLAEHAATVESARPAAGH